jgi:hypothetical protein
MGRNHGRSLVRYKPSARSKRRSAVVDNLMVITDIWFFDPVLEIVILSGTIGRGKISLAGVAIVTIKAIAVLSFFFSDVRLLIMNDRPQIC